MATMPVARFPLTRAQNGTQLTVSNIPPLPLHGERPAACSYQSIWGGRSPIQTPPARHHSLPCDVLPCALMQRRRRRRSARLKARTRRLPDPTAEPCRCSLAPPPARTLRSPRDRQPAAVSAAIEGSGFRVMSGSLTTRNSCAWPTTAGSRSSRPRPGPRGAFPTAPRSARSGCNPSPGSWPGPAGSSASGTGIYA